MPMTASGMSASVKGALEGVFEFEDEDALQDFCDAVAEGVVTYIQSNALVTGTNTCAAGGGTITGTVG